MNYYYDNVEGNNLILYKNYRHFIEERMKTSIRINPSIKSCFGNPTKEKIWDNIIDFLKPDTKTFYNAINQPYKKGFLIYGPTGTGKSEFIFQIASFLWKTHQIPIYLINPKGLDDYELEDLINKISYGFVLIDEWDMFLNTDNNNNNNSDKDIDNNNNNNYNNYNNNSNCPSINAWLNILDRTNNEIIFWFTTNNYDKIAKINDGALIREGRLDHVVKFDLMTAYEAKNAIKVIYSNFNIQILDDIDKLEDYKLEGLTIAKIINHIKQGLDIKLLSNQ
jgi:SpoVK/Ycf46/Vps4 family AAA+-type ATPase